MSKARLLNISMLSRAGFALKKEADHVSIF